MICCCNKEQLINGHMVEFGGNIYRLNQVVRLRKPPIDPKKSSRYYGTYGDGVLKAFDGKVCTISADGALHKVCQNI